MGRYSMKYYQAVKKAAYEVTLCGNIPGKKTQKGIGLNS